jgi:prepilin signal peptidase PulO-like enzyme (type II secretory pathway)
VNLILAVPMELRLAALFMLGICVGGLANLGIYRLAWDPREISPWGPQPAGAAPRRLLDRVPVLGWLSMRREADLHGSGFWMRPMVVELLTGLGFAALYWWEVGQAGLLPPDFRPLAGQDLYYVHLEYALHLVLISLMLVASLIDMDEKTIPDAITVPGTLAGLLLAAAFPNSLLPAPIPLPQGWGDLDSLHVASPNTWPRCLDGCPHVGCLLAALACLWLGCAAIMPWTWREHGFVRGVRFYAAQVARDWSTLVLLVVALIGSIGTATLWYFGDIHWIGLFSALVGMVAGGGLIWLVRVIGTAVLGREAMGFGDVTLMGMIGAFLGWQTTLLVFFLAPFAGLVMGLVQLVLRREDEIPYGPFLCLAALVTIVFWAPLWERTQGVFALGWILIAVLAVCLALMAVLLPVVRWVLSLLR